MANAAQPVLGGPEFLRLLARLSDGAMPATSPALTDRLGQWVDWSRAVALSGALGGRLPEPGEASEAVDDVLADCAHAHASLRTSISEDAEAERLLDLAEAAAAPNFASLRQRYRVLQQAIQTATGRLRGRLRDQLVQVSPELARLAEVDAVMEQTLTRASTACWPRRRPCSAPVLTACTASPAGARPSAMTCARCCLPSCSCAPPIEGLQAALRSH